MILDPRNSILIVIDVQEAFRSVIGDFPLMTSRICSAVKGADLLGIPVIVTEQYPKGLGSTVEELSLTLPESAIRFEKTSFGVLGDATIRDHLLNLGHRQLVVCGLETHVCVAQSCQQMTAAGYEVLLLEDAVSSRFESDRTTALNRLRASGVTLTSVEAMLFEAMQDSRHPRFKDIQSIIK
jgi:nicotinamidase-related amidase